MSFAAAAVVLASAAIASVGAGPLPLKSAEVARSREWRALLHERRSVFGRDESEADGAGFFLSAEGKTNPEAEIVADLAAFRAARESPVDEGNAGRAFTDSAVACRFPARFRFLREKLDPSLRMPACPKFEAWKAQFHARALTVVYAAPYLGSPASMFGHTFLRLSSAGNGVAPLDPSISFEATTGADDGGPLLAFKGVFGFYPGVFSLQPYHLKINLYSNLEARDLWEYELSLTPEEIDRMLDHAWELGSTYFDYYFFNENCSYQLLSLIEAARPALELRERFGPMTVPADTLRVLASVPGLLRKVTRRPSLVAKLETRLKMLSPAERGRFLELRDHLDRLGNTESPELLDALLDWSEYRVVLESKTLYDAEHRVPLALLRARAVAGARGKQSVVKTVAPESASMSSSEGSSGSSAAVAETETVAVAASAESPTALSATPPDQGHATSLISAGGGAERGQGFARLMLRPVLHDVLDSDAGYLQSSRLVIGETALEFQPGAGARLENLTLAEVETLPRWGSVLKPWSWLVGGGLLRPEDTGCAACLAGSFRAAGGLSVGGGPLTAYALARGDLEASGVFSSFFRAGPSAVAGLLWSPVGAAKIHAELTRTWFTGDVSYFGVLGEARFDLSERTSLRLSWQRYLDPVNAVDPDRALAGLSLGF